MNPRVDDSAVTLDQSETSYSPTTMSFVSDNPDMIEEAAVGMSLDVQRLSTTRGSVGLAVTGWQGVEILAGDFGFPIYTEGEISRDALVVAFQLEDGLGSWDGYEMSLDRAWFYTPGSEHSGIGLDGPGNGPPRFATISLPGSAAEALGERHNDKRSPGLEPKWVSRDRHVHGLREITEDALQLAQSGGMTADNARFIERDIVEIVACLCVGPSPEPFETTAARRITGECISIASQLGAMPSMSELSTTIGISDRWIRAAFQEEFGISASAYFRSRALHDAHRELKSAQPGSISVTDVALKLGFWQLGRFSGTYRSFFGELPSTTLARSA